MPSATLRYGYADTPLGQLHYAEAGQGRPIILLHQTPRSHDEYAEVLPLLAESFHAIAMDMYGFGMSAKPEGPQTIEMYALGVLSLADALGLDTFHVMGHHTGAAVALEVAATALHRVSSLVLSSPSYADQKYRDRRSEGAGVDHAEPRPNGQHLLRLWELRAPYYPEDHTDLLDRFIRDALAPGVDPAEGHRACARYVMENRAGRVTARVLVLGASADPFTFPDVDRVGEALTSAASVDVRIIEGGTVAMLEQKPQEIADAVLRFLPPSP